MTAEAPATAQPGAAKSAPATARPHGGTAAAGAAPGPCTRKDATRCAIICPSPTR
jgi:hypothetical protein